MRKSVALWAALACALTAASGANAATEEECKNAIAETEREMSNSAADMMRSDSLQDEWDQRLVRAGGFGVEGEHAKCIELVNEVRSEAGLKQL